MSKLFTRIATMALTIPLSLPASAALDTFLKVPGAPGESTDKAHAKEIDVLSWSWGATNLGPGGVLLAPFTWTQSLDSAFVPLFLSLVNDTSFNPVKLSVRQTGEKASADFFTMTFANAHVLSLSSVGNGDGITVSGAMSYSAIDLSYCPQDPKGGLGQCRTGSFTPTGTGAMSFSGDTQVLRGLAEAGGLVNLAITTVPEPSAMAAALAGLLMVSGWMRRRRAGGSQAA
jgi:type VI secretion system secreted protein Hcp